MTKDEAVECLQQNIHYYEDPFVDVDLEIAEFINQQAAQIERLNKENERMKRACKKWEIVW